MSSEARPISAEQFALAIQELPFENIYSKAHEIGNSIAHLQRSNALLQEYSDSIRVDTGLAGPEREAGDKDCLDAIRENEVVIARQRERVGLLKAEVERRGGRWHEREQEQEQEQTEEAVVNGTVASNGAQSSGRLTDEELTRRMEERMRADDDDDDGGDGMHL